MAQYVEACTRTFTAGGAIPMHARVKLSSGVLALAGIADKELGTAEADAFAAGDVIAVRLRTAYGTAKMIASAALAVGADCYTAASGKVGASASTAFLTGTAISAATANGDIIEVLRHVQVGAAVA